MDVTTMGITRLMGSTTMSTDGAGHQFFQNTIGTPKATMPKSKVKYLTATDTKSLDDNMICSKDGTTFETDYMTLCTGFDKWYHVFSDELQEKCDRVPDPSIVEQKK
ncbi:hypothetical protein BJ170DRAFT_589316 [Xylariales sp. AK1849]|nr:hypothetical protein BJ170DRAFT_589316 [Xylariales sp. AK1849]